ncbi:DoxX family protein [Kiloniella antarctica]|uniref:DoxX family protein n=1 Tax=Kiloniella antarctica TaxID=1550907 RepID=A0ABW5BPA5_9PROT
MLNIFHNTALGLLILRLTLGGLLFLHGLNKLENLSGSIEFIGSKVVAIGLPEFVAYGVLFGEVVAPILIILGLYSRLGALLVIGNMVFAIMLVHTHQLFLLTPQGGWQLELQGFFLLTAVVLLFTGSGRLAVKAD